MASAFYERGTFFMRLKRILCLVTLLCLLGYIAGLILLLITRVRLMQHAWQGVRFALPPALERIIHRYY